MDPALPPAIAGFFEAHNTGQTAGLLSHFTADALVHDEERDYRGDEIPAWLDEATAKYHQQAEVTGVTELGAETIVTALVSGSFPGSPATLGYRFRLEDGRIAELRIGA